MDKGKLVGIIVGLECRLMHQAPDREVGHQESEELLSDQIWSPASQDDFGATQMGLQFVQGGLDHTKLESTVRYLGIEIDDALSMAEQIDL
jgi:hypothetical protein